MSDKKIFRTSRSTSSPSSIGRASAGMPAGLHQVAQRFWKFIKETAYGFAKNTRDPEKTEPELIKAVDRDFKSRRS